MPFYETVVIVDPASGDGTDEKHLAAIRDIIAEKQGTVLKVERWGRRKLAYSIRHKKEGIYFLVEFEAPGDSVARLEQYYRVQESILRYLTVSRESASAQGELSPIAKEMPTDESERGEQRDRPEPSEHDDDEDLEELETDELLTGSTEESVEDDEDEEEEEGGDEDEEEEEKPVEDHAIESAADAEELTDSPDGDDVLLSEQAMGSPEEEKTDS